MEATNPESVIQILGAVAIAIISVVLLAQKLIKTFQSTSAETNIITMMHAELERLNKQNTVLTSELNRLQIEIMHLNTELQKLTLENQRLHTEVMALTNEVVKFKELNRKAQNV